MKPHFLAALLFAAASGAQAQFNATIEPYQKIAVTSGRVTDSRSQAGSPGELAAQVSDTGTDGSGQPFSASSSASTRLGPGYLSGSAAMRFSGTGATSMSLTAYQGDVLTFQRNDAGFDNELIVHYNIVIAGGTTASIDPVASPPGAGKEAGSLDWTFVHQLGDRYLTSWDSKTQLAYDGSVVTTSHWNVGEIGQVYGVYSFSAAVMAGESLNMALYMEMKSRLNAAGASTTGAMAGDAPSIYWGGISQVTDWYGNLVDYRVASASGFNYALSAVPSPAPEPATWLLLIAGATVLGLLGRRRACATRPASA